MLRCCHIVLGQEIDHNRPVCRSIAVKEKLTVGSPYLGRFIVGQGPLIVEALRPQLDTSLSICLLWTGDQPDAETSA